jgi:hypothetical protein
MVWFKKNPLFIPEHAGLSESFINVNVRNILLSNKSP